MIDYTKQANGFWFHPREAQLMLYAATGGDIKDLDEDEQEDLEILIQCFQEWTLEL